MSFTFNVIIAKLKTGCGLFLACCLPAPIFTTPSSFHFLIRFSFCLQIFTSKKVGVSDRKRKEIMRHGRHLYHGVIVIMQDSWSEGRGHVQRWSELWANVPLMVRFVALFVSRHICDFNYTVSVMMAKKSEGVWTRIEVGSVLIITLVANGSSTRQQSNSGVSTTMSRIYIAKRSLNVKLVKTPRFYSIRLLYHPCLKPYSWKIAVRDGK